MSQYTDLPDSLLPLVEQLSALHDAALAQYTPLVESLIATDNRDVRQIEQVLDGLLGFCGQDAALLLYRRLCRHYVGIDAHAAVDYVHAYREHWGDEGITA